MTEDSAQMHHAPSSGLSPELRRLLDAAATLADSAARADFRGADPYDGLWWRWPEVLVGGKRRRQALVQLHARSPIDVRRVYRRDHPRISKALGVFGSVAARAERLRATPAVHAGGLRALELLAADRSAGDRAWGYPWDVQTRWSFYPAGTANVVATSFAASGLLEGARELGVPAFAERAAAAARWVSEELWVEPEGYFAYHPGRPANVHNANLLGAWLVHVVLGHEDEPRRQVARAIARTLAAQRPDGSWPYGEGGGLEWADSFHTGYVITCLSRLDGVDADVADAVARSAEHYRGFFDPTGRARLWHDKPFPEDAHSAGTGLSTLAVLVRRGHVSRELLERVAARVLQAGLRGGHAVHRRYRAGRSTVRYVRWCDAHVALGLVDAAAALAGRGDLAPAPAARVADRRAGNAPMGK